MAMTTVTLYNLLGVSKSQLSSSVKQNTYPHTVKCMESETCLLNVCVAQRKHLVSVLIIIITDTAARFAIPQYLNWAYFRRTQSSICENLRFPLMLASLCCD